MLDQENRRHRSARRVRIATGCLVPGKAIFRTDPFSDDMNLHLRTATDPEASYSSPVGATFGSKRHAVFLTRRGLVAVAPQTGAVLFERMWRSRTDASVNAATPLVVGHVIFVSASYGAGAGAFRVNGSELTPLGSGDESLSSLDPSVPDAHALLGMVAALYDYDWQEAERRFQLALVREPVRPEVRRWYGYAFLLPVGLAADAEAALRQILDLDEHFVVAHYWFILTLAWQGRLDEALTSAETAFTLTPRNSVAIGDLAGLLTLKGNEARANQLLETSARATALRSHSFVFTSCAPRSTKPQVGSRKRSTNGIRWRRFSPRLRWLPPCATAGTGLASRT